MYTSHALTGFYVSVTMSCQCLCFERFPRRLFKFSSYSIGTLLQLLRRNLLRLVFKIVPSYIVLVFCCQVGNNVLHWNTTMNIAWLAICHLLFSFECGGVFSLTICWYSKPYRPWCILTNLFLTTTFAKRVDSVAVVNSLHCERCLAILQSFLSPVSCFPSLLSAKLYLQWLCYPACCHRSHHDILLRVISAALHE